MEEGSSFSISFSLLLISKPIPLLTIAYFFRILECTEYQVKHLVPWIEEFLDS